MYQEVGTVNIKKVISNRVIQNAGWLIGGKVLNKVIAFVVAVLTARYLGPGNYGLINYAAAYTTFFASICTLGIDSVIVKNFLDYPDEEGETLGTAICMRLASSIFSAVMIIGIVFVVDNGEPLTIGVVALSSLALIFQVYDTVNYWFQSKLMSKYPAIASNIAYVTVSIFKIVLLVGGKDVRWFAISNALDYIVAALFLFYIYRKQGGTRLRFSWKKGRQLLSKSYNFIIAGLMVSIYASTDKFMLKQWLDESSVGYYSLASSFSVTWAFVLSAIIESMHPVIVQSYQHNYQLYERKNRQLYAIVFYVSIFMSLVIAITAEPLILFLYGAQYLSAVEPLRIVVWYTAFSYLGVARNIWMVCENKQKYLNYLYFSAAVMNVLMNMLLIPIWGASGAAAASLITQISTTTILPAAIRPLRQNVKLMIDAAFLRDVFSGRSN